MTVQIVENFSCLIVEDDVSFATMAANVARESGAVVTLVHNLAEARKAASQSFDLVLLDNHLPDGKGYEFYHQISRRNPESPIIMITGAPDLGEAVALTRNGLFEYLTKPISVDALVASLNRAKMRISSQRKPDSHVDWLGDAPAMRDVLQMLRQAAKHASSTVLLTGETGTGKDLAARVLHQLSFPAGNAPFIAVNCAALPGEMFESELFGAERGAFTGADRKRGGLAAAAAKGTLFLDEIGEVPMAYQPKLLRLLEAREFRALGSTESQPFTGRFVAATNKNLAEEVKAGRFREDLLYRFDVFSIEMPPLRQRRSDIPAIAEVLLGQLIKKYDRSRLLLSPEDGATLMSHDFPGNVRELRNVLERSLLKTPDDAKWLSLDVNWMNRSTISASTKPIAAPVTLLTPTGMPPVESPTERELPAIEAQEYRLIRDTLLEENGGIRRAAARLGISPQALLRRLEKWPELRVNKE